MLSACFDIPLRVCWHQVLRPVVLGTLRLLSRICQCSMRQRRAFCSQRPAGSVDDDRLACIVLCGQHS